MSATRSLHQSIGVDVGGTFTDLVLFDSASGRLAIQKVPTTVHDQSRGFLTGLDGLGVRGEAVGSLVHGTTVATNAILQRAGARCGLITTRGFRDTLELGRRTRPTIYGLEGVFLPIIPRNLRTEVRERIAAGGEVLIPLDENDVRAAVRYLLEQGVESLVIHFMHAYRNPAHEERCFEIARELWPNEFISVGSRIIREIREFERASTVAVNGYTRPIISRYLQRLAKGLGEKGFTRELMIMQGNGGVMSASVACEQTVQTVMSGPAAGAISASWLAAAAGIVRVINCDMGGTSFDVSVVIAGQPEISSELEIDYQVPIRVPMVSIHTIGSGGGSICKVSAGGILQVGPQSAGADPGPVCYGRGGVQPTITDAHVLLGRLDPRALTGTTGEVGIDRIRAAVRDHVAGPLGMDEIAAAGAIVALSDQQMASAIRLVSVDKGHDPRDFALVAYGGAGPLHAVELARELGIPRVLVPRYPGLVCALGGVLADIRHDFVQHINAELAVVDGGMIERVLADQVQAGRALIGRESDDILEVVVSHELDMRYEGQTHEFRIPMSGTGFDAQRVARDFAAYFRDKFDIELPEMTPVLVNVRTTLRGRRQAPDLHAFLALAGARAGPSPARSRQVYFDGAWMSARILRRDDLAAGEVIDGPAIIEQMDATTVLPPASRGEVDELGNILITVRTGPAQMPREAHVTAAGDSHVA